MKIPELLRASHIKSWSESNPEERLDADNGLLLIANIDAAFDRHLISFEDNGVMLFSKELGDDPCQTLGISQGASIRYDLNENQKKYLRQHREKLRK
ncbi:HNH endonuclease [Acetobacter thailandicus]|uniref:HNH endonuclease n=1 Tax=Acetobacter thailandicus TaxID=1502842 RepID=UPI001568D8C3|nr:hypothetical protein [Acetobacter thailandicus]